MLLLKDWGKFLFGVMIVIAVSYVYYHLSSGSSNINFVITLILTPFAIFALLIVYCDNDDSARNKKLFWLTLYFISPILCNSASIGFGWSGYETASYYVFKLRYWTLLKGPLFGILYFLYFMFGGDVKKRLQLSMRGKARQTTFVN